MSLSDFRVGAEPAKPKPTGLPPIAHGLVLAFDQSVGATGWAVMRSGQSGVLVDAVGSIRTDPNDYPLGHEGTLQRAVYVHDEMAKVFASTSAEHCVHETPPVGGKMARPESSLLGGLAVRILANRFGLALVMVQNQHSKSVICGNGNATKPQWHAGLTKFDLQGVKPTNEGQRDAVCLALTFFIDRAV